MAHILPFLRVINSFWQKSIGSEIYELKKIVTTQTPLLQYSSQQLQHMGEMLFNFCNSETMQAMLQKLLREY